MAAFSRPTRILVLTAACALCACSAPDQGVSLDDERAARLGVERAMDSFRRHSASAQWDSLASLYSDAPGFRFAENGAVPYGSVSDIRTAIGNIPEGTTLNTVMDDIQIDVVRPDVAVLTAPYRTSFVDSTGPVFTYGGVLTLVWVLENGCWRIRNGHSSAPVPRDGSGGDG